MRFRPAGFACFLGVASCFPSFDVDGSGGAGGSGAGGSSTISSGGAGGTAQNGTATTVGGGGEGAANMGGNGGEGGGNITCTPGAMGWRVNVGSVSNDLSVAANDNHIQSIALVEGKAFIAGYTEQPITGNGIADDSFFVAEVDYLTDSPAVDYHVSYLSAGLAPAIAVSASHTQSELWVAIGASNVISFYELPFGDIGNLEGPATMTCTNAHAPSLASWSGGGYLSMQLVGQQATCDLAVPCEIMPIGDTSSFLLPLPAVGDVCDSGIYYGQTSQFGSINQVAVAPGGVYATSIAGPGGDSHQRNRYLGSKWQSANIGGTDTPLPTFVTPLLSNGEAYVAGTTIKANVTRTFIEAWNGDVIYDSNPQLPANVLMRAAAANDERFVLAGSFKSTPPQAWLRRVGGAAGSDHFSNGTNAVVTAVATDACGNVVLGGTYKGSGLDFGTVSTSDTALTATAFIQFVPFDKL
ncbi:MAG: hypothetical protein HOW73_46765 [Polyangiaceae bacterium]|nr:hypothetical protein [Polyangiaceae bacterium]